MPLQKVFIVVKRDLAYNDCFYDFTGGEEVIAAFRSFARAQALAHDLSQDNECTIDPSEETQDDHVVIEALVEVDDAQPS